MEGRVGLGFLVAQAETKPQICLSGGKDGGGNGNVIPPLTLCVGLCLLRETQSGSGAASGRRPAAGPRSHVGSSVPSETEQMRLHSCYEDAERCPSFPRFHRALPLSLGAITQSGRTCKLGPVLCSLEDQTVTLLHGTLPIKFNLWFGPRFGCTMLRVQWSSVLLRGPKSEAAAFPWVLPYPREQQHRLLSPRDLLVTCSWGKQRGNSLHERKQWCGRFFASSLNIQERPGIGFSSPLFLEQ